MGGSPPREVVLLTFTNLAAEEMKGRLRDRIKQLSTGSLGSTLRLTQDCVLRQIKSN